MAMKHLCDLCNRSCKEEPIILQCDKFMEENIDNESSDIKAKASEIALRKFPQFNKFEQLACEKGYIEGAKEQEEIRKNFEGTKLLIENLNRENAELQEKNQKLIDKACEFWFTRLQGFLGEGLAKGCVEEFRKKMEE